MRIPSGVTDQVIYFVAVDATDFTTRETGLSSFTVYRSRNGGAATAFTTPTVTEVSAANMPGVYKLLLDEDMTIDAGDDSQEMCFHITHAGMAPVTRTIELYRPKITAGVTLGVEADGDLTKVNTLDGHTPQTGDSFARIGATGSGLTSLAQASVCTEARLAELDAANLPADVDQVKADLPQRITKNTALSGFMFFMVDSADHVTGKTGLTVTATRSLDGAAFAACANAVTEVSNGWYKIDLAAADLNANVVALKFTATGADARMMTLITQPT